MSRRILGKQELLDVTHGAALLATGGGGSTGQGKGMIEDLLLGKRVELISVDEVEEKAKILVVGGMGAPEVISTRKWSKQATNAFDALEKFTGEKFDYVIPPETGAEATLLTMVVAADKRIPTVDADGCGRAIPEIQQTMFYIHQIPMSPAAIADNSSTWVVVNTEDPLKMEDLCRAVTTELGMQTGLAYQKMTGSELKKAAIPGTVSRAEKVGRAIREAKSSGTDPVSSVVSIVDGVILGRGRVTQKVKETKQGFTFGKVIIQGKEGDLTIDYKNENMLAWKGRGLIAMVPDSICYIGANGDPLSNFDVKEGMDIVVIGIKAHPAWRTPAGVHAFKRTIEAMGYNGEYRKIEDLNR